MPLWDGHPSPDEEREPAEQQPCPSNAGGQQSQGKEREPAEHQSCLANGEGQQNQDKERELAEHDPCPANFRLDNQHLRPSTLPILQRFMKHRRRLSKLRDASPDRFVFDSTHMQTFIMCTCCIYLFFQVLAFRIATTIL